MGLSNCFRIFNEDVSGRDHGYLGSIKNYLKKVKLVQLFRIGHMQNKRIKNIGILFE
jgi:hypothetical protein